ncbi:MAG: hypothetical protein ACOX7A_01345 [Lawsonibacter sp.]|jgi:hypothetical protein
MLIEESKRRQAKLKDYLLSMAADCLDETQIRQMVIRFKELYSNNFRHNYSEFFPLIVDIAQNDNEYSLDYLSNNLEAMRLLVENDYIGGEKEFKGLYQPLTKLSDHINLEIGRYSYYSVNEQKVNDLEKKNQALQIELRNATGKLIEAQRTVSSVQTELIAVLSIFAAIVLTFSGSMTLLGGAFGSIANTPFFKSISVLLIGGLIVFNTIFLMLYIVGKITNRNIYARCKTKDCSCGENGEPTCWGINRIRKRLPYVFWLNLTFLLLIIINTTLWILNMKFHFFPNI